MTKGNGNGNGHGHDESGITVSHGHVPFPDGSEAPREVLELAASCVRFVMARFKIELDFTRETLPLLDHYVAEARPDVKKRPESLALTAQAIGAYLGEVVRRLHPCWWRMEENASEWRLEFRRVPMCMYPVELAYAALTMGAEGGEQGGIEVADRDDWEAALRRLDELPAVEEEDYYRPSTRLEALDIVVEAVAARRFADPDTKKDLTPADYE